MSWWAGDRTGREPGWELESLRRALAALLGADEDTWPEHGNAPLAIAAAFAMLKARAEAAEAENKALREALESVWLHHGGTPPDGCQLCSERCEAALAASGQDGSNG